MDKIVSYKGININISIENYYGKQLFFARWLHYSFVDITEEGSITKAKIYIDQMGRRNHE